MGFLASAPDDTRIGGKALIGLAFVKQGETSHPKVGSAVQACTAMARMSLADVRSMNEMYSLGLAIIFLSELDPSLHRESIELLLAHLYGLQKEAGAWGYTSGANESSCDTSMSQYAILAMWTASRGGIPVPPEKFRKACEWLIRTQDPKGAWGYQGQVADAKSFERRDQAEIRPSMAAAGLGSLYVCANLMNIRHAKAPDKKSLGDLPPVLIPVDPLEAEMGRGVKSSLSSFVNRGLNEGEAWFDANFVAESAEYNYYYVYTLERYKSFAELQSGKREAEPAWYDQIVASLAAKQAENGAWSGSEGDAVCTAFATLCLMRGTRKSIQAANLGSGTLMGGRGLPTDLAQVRLQGQKIAAPKLTASAKEVLEMLDETAADLRAYAEQSARVTLSSSVSERADQLERFRNLVRDSEDEVARRVAIQALTQSRTIENAPALIAALASKDPRTVLVARDALRNLSRRPAGWGPPDEFSADDQQAAIQAWTEWYRELSPD